MTYKQLRIEFTRQSFRRLLKEKLSHKCANCSSNENIEYHHIVPLKNGGTNNLNNIVPLCVNCHYKAHDKSKLINKKGGKGGRPKIELTEDVEDILKLYYDLKIGTKKTKELLGISYKNKSTFYNLRKQYEEKHNITNFYNNIDLLDSQSKRLGYK